jgi:hypothetical protein
VKIGLKTSGEGIAHVQGAMKTLKKAEVLVGIPEANGSRRKGQITNAQLLFIHSNGSPKRGIPKRRVIEPAITAPQTQPRIENALGAAAVSALDGDHAGMVANLDKAGTIGESASKRWFTDPANGWPQNTVETINRKLDRLSPKKREAAIDAIVAAGGDAAGIVTPLIRTGQMRRAITHVLEGVDQ